MSTAHWQGRRLPIPAAWPVRSSPAARPWAIVSADLAPVLLTGAYLIAGTGLGRPGGLGLAHGRGGWQSSWPLGGAAGTAAIASFRLPGGLFADVAPPVLKRMLRRRC